MEDTGRKEGKGITLVKILFSGRVFIGTVQDENPLGSFYHFTQFVSSLH